MFTTQHVQDLCATGSRSAHTTHFEPTEWGPASQHLDNPSSREAARTARDAQDYWDLLADRPDDN
ncbi:MAG: hypothetical protein ACSLEW_14505 [Nocardioides sp.]